MNAFSPPHPPHPPAPLPSPARSFMQIVGTLTLGVGMLVLGGWFAGSEVLVTFGFQGIPMTANSAIGFSLCGAAMLGLNASLQHLRTAAQAIIPVVVVIAMASLVEQVAGINFGIDELLFLDPYTRPPLAPGRMAPNSAAGFVLLTAALGLMYRPHTLKRWRPWLLGGLGLALAMLGTTALLGYLTGFRGFYSWWQLRALPVPVALLFLLQGVAIIGHILAETGVRWLLGRWLLGGFALGLALVVATAVYSRTTTEAQAKAAASVAHTLEIEATIRQLEAAIDVKTVSFQGYLLTDNATLRQRTTETLTTIRRVLAELRGLAAANPALQNYLDRTEQLINERDEFIRQLISTRQASANGAPAGPNPTQGAKLLSDKIKAHLEELIAYADSLLASQQKDSALLLKRAASILPIEIFLMSLLTLAALLRLNAEAAAHSRFVDKLSRSEALKASILN